LESRMPAQKSALAWVEGSPTVLSEKDVQANLIIRSSKVQQP